ncbi:MAG: FkbM family methyltransferase [Deltaproteobacteria bacterium]|nr:FkbM family methyltransferase [Deltaproteobacteria bacterium]
MERRSLLVGSLAGAAATAAIARATQPELERHRSEAKISYAQQGEDLIVEHLFRVLENPRPSYIDIGAWEPILNNNTYLLYEQGSRGLLVEPNPYYAERLRRERPGDLVLTAGIGVTQQAEADFYIIRGDGQNNTFDKAQADLIAARLGPQAIERVIKMPLVNINDVLAKNFPPGGPHFFSTDVEGLDLEILQALDFTRFRPQVIITETMTVDTWELMPEIIELVKAQDYSVRGSTFVNTTFIDNRALKKRG